MPPHKVFSCFVHHYGYVFATEEEKKKHQQRNMTLLKKELVKQGMTPQLCAQMVQELLVCEDTKDAGYEFCLQGLDELERKGQLSDACSQWAIIASVRYFKTKQNYQGLLERAARVRKQYKLTQMAQLALAGVVIETSAPEGNVKAILEYAPLYRGAWDWLISHENEAITQNQMDFSNYKEPEYAIQVFQAAAFCANAVGRFEEAMEYWNYLPWNEEGFDASAYEAARRETENGLQELLAHREKIKQLQELLAVWKEAMPAVRSLLETDRMPEAGDLLAGMQEIVIAFGNKLENTFGETNVAELVRMLEGCCEKIWQCANAKNRETSLMLYKEIEQILNQIPPM